jgi:hypothetical protein
VATRNIGNLGAWPKRLLDDPRLLIITPPAPPFRPDQDLASHLPSVHKYGTSLSRLEEGECAESMSVLKRRLRSTQVLMRTSAMEMRREDLFMARSVTASGTQHFRISGAEGRSAVPSTWQRRPPVTQSNCGGSAPGHPIGIACRDCRLITVSDPNSSLSLRRHHWPRMTAGTQVLEIRRRCAAPERCPVGHDSSQHRLAGKGAEKIEARSRS